MRIGQENGATGWELGGALRQEAVQAAHNTYTPANGISFHLMTLAGQSTMGKTENWTPLSILVVQAVLKSDSDSRRLLCRAQNLQHSSIPKTQV